MTTTQLYLFYLFNFFYLVLSVVVAILTRATPKRIAGAVAGGAASGVVTLCLGALWERLGWWREMIIWEPYFLALSLICMTLCAYIFLITWRIARRFGWRGLAVVLVVLAAMGPLRDQLFVRRLPELGSYGPGIAPVLAISASYVVLVLVGHGVMRLVAGPAREDRLARRPWESS
jgi:hypothetical protein